MHVPAFSSDTHLPDSRAVQFLLPYNQTRTFSNENAIKSKLPSPS